MLHFGFNGRTSNKQLGSCAFLGYLSSPSNTLMQVTKEVMGQVFICPLPIMPTWFDNFLTFITNFLHFWPPTNDWVPWFLSLYDSYVNPLSSCNTKCKLICLSEVDWCGPSLLGLQFFPQEKILFFNTSIFFNWNWNWNLPNENFDRFPLMSKTLTHSFVWFPMCN